MSEVVPSLRPQPTGREVYEACLSGARDRPFIPRLRSDPLSRPIPHSLVEFREQEGKENRERRLHDLWRRLPSTRFQGSETAATLGISLGESLTPEGAENVWRAYEDELLRRCGGHTSSQKPTHIPWPGFRDYAEAKEAELWCNFHDILDLDGNGHLDSEELRIALENAGITLSPTALAEFITFLTQSPHSHVINFRQFRDFLLLHPRQVSPSEIYRYYEVKKFLGNDGRGSARVTMEGDVSLSAEDNPVSIASFRVPAEHLGSVHHGGDVEEEPEEHRDWLHGHPAVMFLLAGGIAGAVSRTCTAPFDRLKIFLITRPPEMRGTPVRPKPSGGGLKAIGGAVARIYAEGGILAFWTGNGLSIMKIFPESAIKFMTYETAKRAFGKYWDHVEDPRDISGSSRFLSGGIGGIASQLSIYPIETLKTQMMSTTGQKRNLLGAARHVWQLGQFRAFYRGLTIGLVGVFPYSAIDMSTFEALKLTYLRSTGQDEPSGLAVLAFGSISGSVGAISVYPLNLVRTRLQASGSPGHPQRYTGAWDVVQKTYQRDGWRGFYRGLFPTLAKVVPSVSITYLVYEHSKRRLGV
ncbi:mitochondrial carrier domain-containing protein [Boletus edulis BED1]|uniref:Mitochondrial carrier domain-containing protein n=1 Tax=Boletus edulis BED1 TaxID=1328754 RepID=A0AAD4C6T2_BOLED|nr:mitochondrial carrier domain-containing protein [Boletus edulis BED1]